MKYKVGDKVRIRKDLIVGMGHGVVRVTENMLGLAGSIATVKRIIASREYLLDISERYIWTDEMLEDVESGVLMIKIYQDGNRVIAKKEGKFGVARCSPEDKFDILTGAKLALERLEEECKPYAWLKDGVRYYVPNVTENRLYYCFTYEDNPADKRMKERGAVFKTEGEAIEAAKKMLAVLKESDSNDER